MLGWHAETMAVSRAERRRDRRPRVLEVFGSEQVETALDLLELTEFAWHDCYHDITPPDEVIDDILVLSQGDISELIGAARLAVTDWRDLRLAADAKR